jgi:hypothetical protein
MFSRWYEDPLNSNNTLEKVQTHFLRQIAGLGKFSHKALLQKELVGIP